VVGETYVAKLGDRFVYLQVHGVSYEPGRRARYLATNLMTRRRVSVTAARLRRRADERAAAR
jgi:hypothetical protein